VGYEINKQPKIVLYYREGCVVGAYGVSFNLRSNFIYTSLTDTHGYFIRKSRWT